MASKISVPTFMSAAPREVRQQVCSRLAAAVNTDTAFWYGVAEDGTVRNAVAVGSPRVQEALSRLAGSRAPAGAVASETVDVLRARRGAWRLQAPPRQLRLRFRGLLDDYVSAEAFEQLPIWSAFYRPCGIRDQLRLLPYADSTFLGWIGAVRDDGRAFTRLERRAADMLAREVTHGLATARALATMGGGLAHVLLRPDGKAEGSCTRVVSWLTPERLSMLGEATRAADRGGLSGCRIDATKVSFSRLDGAGGVRYLALLSDEVVPQLPASDRLSAAERAVADGAAAGLTVRELAQDLGVSANTVKYHLKNAYQKLGVSTRLELLRELGRDASS